MKILILGGTGMFGHKLVQIMSEKFETWATIRSAFEDVAYTGLFSSERTLEKTDVRKFEALEEKIASLRPDVVINAVGVIKQAPAHRDVAELMTINSILPHKLAEISCRHGFRLILISTDCVFSGRRGNYSESDPADAGDIYGRSKLLGEVDGENCLTLRTSMIGRELASSHSLTEWFLSQPRKAIRGFEKAIYSGFPTVILSEIIRDIILGHPHLRGIFHLSSDPISKLDLLRLLNRGFDTRREIVPDSAVVINRSLNSTRFRGLTGFHPVPWQKMIDRMVGDPTPYPELRSVIMQTKGNAV